MREMDTKSLAT